MTALLTYGQKSAQQVRDDYLRTLKNGLIALGIPTPNIGPGSDDFIRATAIGNEIAVGQANNVILADQLMPDTAAGAFLDRWLAILGLSRRPAIGSSGLITPTISVSGGTLIVTGTQLIDSVGLRYQVTVGGTYAPGATVPIASVDTGKATNHANGDQLKWVTAPAFTAANATVGTTGGTDGLTGGADSEVGLDEPPRARLLSLMQNPPKGGNSSDVILWCGQSSPDVQGAWCYPALLGPGTVFAAVAQSPQTTGPFSSTSKNRDIAGPIIIGAVQPYVQGQLPEHVFSVIASVVNQPTDVAILLSLPSAPTASPPGPGGGWLDGTPWPQSVNGMAAVTVLGSPAPTSTVFTVSALTAPTPGVSRIAWLSPTNWTLYTATVLSVTGTTGAYAITIDTPMPGIAAGNYIWPQAAQQANYVAAILSAFSTMGAGEWSASPSVLSRAFRHPVPTLAWPYSLGAVQLKTVINSGSEVLDANWIYRSSVTPAVGVATVDPTSGAFTGTPPAILTPRNIGIYAQ